MKRFKLFKIAAALLGGLLALSILSEPGLANSQTSNLRQGLPGRRISGGSRSPSTACLLGSSQPKENHQVIALTPESNLSRTVMDRPDFWFVLPAINTDRSIEFSVMNRDEEIVYRQTLQPTGKAGLAAIALPETAPELDENQIYKWHLSVICDPTNRATDLVVWGWIERTAIEPSFQQKIAQANSQERLALYEELTVWNDRLTALSDLYRDRTTANQDTTELDVQWTALLTSENLGQLPAAAAIGSLIDISGEMANTYLPSRSSHLLTAQ